MTYNVFGGTLSLTQSINFSLTLNDLERLFKKRKSSVNFCSVDTFINDCIMQKA